MLVGLVSACYEANLFVGQLLKEHFKYQPISISEEYDDEIKGPENLLRTLNLASASNGSVTIFNSANEALDFVTLNYHSNYVLLHENRNLCREVDIFSTRPFYCTLGVKISMGLSLHIITANSFQTSHQMMNMKKEELISQLENLHSPIEKYCKYYISLKEFNENDQIIDSMKHILCKLKLSIRPTWDFYFMEIAKLTSQRSNCMKRRVGAILVSRQSHRIISTGYNGTPAGLPNCFEGGCKRCNENVGGGSSLSTCLCLHAEENAIFEAGRDRISLYTNENQGVTLYTTSCPCIYCAKKIIQACISEVVYLESYFMDDFVKELLKGAKVNLRILQSYD